MAISGPRGPRSGSDADPHLRAAHARRLREQRTPGNGTPSAARPVPPADAKNDARCPIGTFGAPTFAWHQFQPTCVSFLTNTPGIFRAASAWRSGAQLGHDAGAAPRHFLGVLRGIPEDARTLDDAMKVAPALDVLVAIVGGSVSIMNVRAPRTTLRVAV